jgi:hypothetical protein
MGPRTILLRSGLISFLCLGQVTLGQMANISYQGRLNASGAPATGLFDLRFLIYPSVTGGSPLAGAITTATSVSNGLFTVVLSLNSAVFDGTDRWVEIAVRPNGSTNGFTVLSPRQSVSPTPYALRAENYSGPVSAYQISGPLSSSQISGTISDNQLSTNVALLNANQLFAGTNTFANYANVFMGDGSGLTGLNADNLVSGTVSNERLPPNIARLDLPQLLYGTEDSGASLRIEGPGTNNWVMLSNGAVWLPAFTFPSEDGGDAQRGGIYFGSAGGTGPQPDNNHYILNIVNRGDHGGQLLISHQSIALEEQSGGEIIFGNDGSDGGLVTVRYDDSMGNSLIPGQGGHSHVVVFQARSKDTNGVIHSAYPAIVGFHSGSASDPFPGNPGGNYGSSSAGEFAFYTHTPWPGTPFVDGVEMGRMETNGWKFRGTMTYQKASATVTAATNYLDFGTNNYLEFTLNTSPVVFRTVNPHRGSNSVQTLTLIVHAGGAARSVTFPSWKVLSPTGSSVLPTTIAAGTTTVVRLEVLDGGGDANTLARFESYLGP